MLKDVWQVNGENYGRFSLKYSRERYVISGGREIHAFAFTRIISADRRNKWAGPVGLVHSSGINL